MRTNSAALFGASLPLLALASQIPITASAIKDMPMLGFGTWNLEKSNASEAVSVAIQNGYRHIDAAVVYGNQKEVGEGIKEGLSKANIERKNLWVTSKLWNNRHSEDEVPKALDDTLKQLELEYLDLYLMHWPVSEFEGRPEIEYVETWKAMTKLPATGRVRHVGVSNFSPRQLDEIMQATPSMPPFAHQFETHPYLPQSGFLEYHHKHNIRVTAYSPLGNANPTYSSTRKASSARYVPPLLSNDLVKTIAGLRGCTPAQVVLKWGMLRGTNVIPKSQHADRIVENWKSTGCVLEAVDLVRLSQELPLKRFNNPSKAWHVKLFVGLEGAAETFYETMAKLRGGTVEVLDGIAALLGGIPGGL